MTNEAETMMKGSAQEDALCIIHNALVLIIAKEKIKWLKQNGCLHICMITLNGLQDGTPYAENPVVTALTSRL